MKTSKAEKKRRSLPPPEPAPPGSSFPKEAFAQKSFFHQEVLHQSSKSSARVTRVTTPHGSFLTPSFVAVATNAALKGVSIDAARAANQDLIFCNSYHLLLQPGPEVIEEAGGLHKYMGMKEGSTMGPLITDSGGFQVFSLKYGTVFEDLKTAKRTDGSFDASLDVSASRGELKRAARPASPGPASRGGSRRKSSVKVTEEGVVFTSYRDGREVLLTPESTVAAQKAYGSDIIIPLDELPSYDTSREDLVKSVELTHRWEARSLREHLKDVKGQAMYGVVHGGVERDVRKGSLDYLTDLPFDGFCVGGSLGGNREEMLGMLDYVMEEYREIERSKFGRSKPLHLLGIADEASIREAVTLGIDTFDSCYPTRLARHGTLLTREGKLHIKSGKHKKSYGVPIDEKCGCDTCKKYDRAYMNHLYRASEPLFL
eukprot:CAMPEP_0182476526 /NCGR_PEP_ID=MMETSP1319-20130603/29248_1 /TAXON_ID=172717 /ORGANISM="Bolidomonas pacifica, Strain RCC208" /LENGTH=428 /DNA_ID=CAMNT_0024677621 /DNA_START=101 /DNA_END=1384 /DNA_ORIENTATION=-